MFGSSFIKWCIFYILLTNLASRQLTSKVWEMLWCFSVSFVISAGNSEEKLYNCFMSTTGSVIINKIIHKYVKICQLLDDKSLQGYTFVFIMRHIYRGPWIRTIIFFYLVNLFFDNLTSFRPIAASRSTNCQWKSISELVFNGNRSGRTSFVWFQREICTFRYWTSCRILCNDSVHVSCSEQRSSELFSTW